jgi:hypothetical protein
LVDHHLPGLAETRALERRTKKRLARLNRLHDELDSKALKSRRRRIAP